MLKPHVWIEGQGWCGNFKLNSETDWKLWEQDYEKYLLTYAKIAQENKVEILCIGTEFKISVVKRSNFWVHLIKKIKIMDSGIDECESTSDLDSLVDDFAFSLSKTCLRITNPEKDESAYDGIVFFFDEADSACPNLHMGYFFKAVTELLQQNGCDNVMFVVAGLPDVIEKLLSHQKLEQKYKDNSLGGKLSNHRDCHIETDWILIYRVTDYVLILERTGSHSDLF